MSEGVRNTDGESKQVYRLEGESGGKGVMVRDRGMEREGVNERERDYHHHVALDHSLYCTGRQ